MPEDLNHASIRLEGPAAGSTVAVDESGKIALTGYLHKEAARCMTPLPPTPGAL